MDLSRENPRDGAAVEDERAPVLRDLRRWAGSPAVTSGLAANRLTDVPAPLLDFAALYREHARDVHRFALYLCGDEMLAEDLLSEAFVRVWTARERVDLVTVRAYLFAIVRNLFLQDVNRRRRSAPLPERLASASPGPEARATAQSELRAVVAALAALPEIDRAAVLMRADGGLPYDEIARALGISTGTAKVKVHRARLKLAESLHAGSTKEGRS
jgi:RNA polymerase sigma-70 factor (ECF subfamily)